MDAERPKTADLVAERAEPLACEAAKIINIDMDRRRVTHVISTARLDRGNRVVDVDGWKLANFKRAPRVLADHDYSIERVIGRAIDTKVDGDRLVSTTEFAEDGLGDVAFRLVTTGLVNTWSVGWKGINAHYFGDVEGCAVCKKAGKTAPYGVHFTEQELLEYSLVAIPANPDAVMGLQAAGLVSEASARAWIDATSKPAPPATPEADDDPVVAEPPKRSSEFYTQLFALQRTESIRAASRRVQQLTERLSA